MNTQRTTPELTSETLKTIFERRSVRKFKDTPVENYLIAKIIEAGCMAPSAMNTQPRKFYVLTSPDTIQTFSKEIVKAFARESIHSGPSGVIKLLAGALYSFYYGGLSKGFDVFYRAPVVIFLTAPKDSGWECYDIGMCAQNMMLAAKTLGLDSCPLGVGKLVEHSSIYYKLRVPYPETVHLAISIGYGDEHPHVHKRVGNNVVYVDGISNSGSNETD